MIEVQTIRELLMNVELVFESIKSQDSAQVSMLLSKGVANVNVKDEPRFLIQAARRGLDILAPVRTV